MGRNRLHNSGVPFTEVKANSPPMLPAAIRHMLMTLDLKNYMTMIFPKLKASNKLY